MNNLGIKEVMYEGVSSVEKDFVRWSLKDENAGVDLFIGAGAQTAGRVSSCGARAIRA